MAGDGVGVGHRGPGVSYTRASWGRGQLKFQWAQVKGKSLGAALARWLGLELEQVWARGDSWV